MLKDNDHIDISELKQITEEAEAVKPDPNKMHYESLANMAQNCPDEEAKIMIDIFAIRFPEIMLQSLSNRITRLQNYFNASVQLSEELGR